MPVELMERPPTGERTQSLLDKLALLSLNRIRRQSYSRICSGFEKLLSDNSQAMQINADGQPELPVSFFMQQRKGLRHGTLKAGPNGNYTFTFSGITSDETAQKTVVIDISPESARISWAWKDIANNVGPEPEPPDRGRELNLKDASGLVKILEGDHMEIVNPVGMPQVPSVE